ncbi:MAG: hypothetical protein ABI968_14510 [Acidobacteriota bacterium]
MNQPADDPLAQTPRPPRIDGAKALRKAIRSVFSEAPVRRCIKREERNVLDGSPTLACSLPMARQISLLRGINLGAPNRIAMRTPRAAGRRGPHARL